MGIITLSTDLQLQTHCQKITQMFYRGKIALSEEINTVFNFSKMFQHCIFKQMI